ncbi:MAG: ABC transporter permease, partial [Staphylococcus lugdunensis]|nr:ABC transporter permease [Staphylococcus lugdunensis]
MGSLIKQECFKLSKKKSTWIWPIVIIAIMFTLLFISQNSDIMSSEGLIQGGFSGFYWVVILMIVQASTIISMEFHYETIKNVLYRNYSRTSIVISKVITLVIYSLICFIGVIAVTLLLYAISFNDIDLLAPHGSQPPLLNEMLLLAVADFVTMWLVLSLT